MDLDQRQRLPAVMRLCDHLDPLQPFQEQPHPGTNQFMIVYQQYAD
ncbi:MAG: hypothetical protein MPW15_16480 [Candidatus Manganitrophus sp.]|nr:hypothetical protein [Candidatus Manganitrophus sp.]